MSAEGLAGVCN